MEAICINCRFVGTVRSKQGLVCSQTDNFDSVKHDDVCEKYQQFSCEKCGSESEDLFLQKCKLDDHPDIVRTQYQCNCCHNTWVVDIVVS